MLQLSVRLPDLIIVFIFSEDTHAHFSVESYITATNYINTAHKNTAVTLHIYSTLTLTIY